MSARAGAEATRRHPRTWVLWVVRAVLALTVTGIGAGSISTIWLGQATGSFWWLVYALPQVSIALSAVLICWDRDSRPEGEGVTAGTLNMFGMVVAVIFMKWLVLGIGILTILVMLVRPREWIYSGTPPPRFVRLRRLWSSLVRR